MIASCRPNPRLLDSPQEGCHNLPYVRARLTVKASMEE